MGDKHHQNGAEGLKHIIIGLLFALTVFANPAMAVEEPAYTAILHENDFELRDYPRLVVAEVQVTGSRTAAASKGFRLLAGYIFGSNIRRQGIPMTAPVIETPSQPAPMTAPVLQTRVDGAWIVRFTMPSRYTLDSLPKPESPEVHLTVAPPMRVAVIRFSGLIYEGVVSNKSEALRAFIKAHHLRAAGPPSLAQYDPPWTLWFLRRNEIMIPVDTAA